MARMLDYNLSSSAAVGAVNLISILTNRFDDKLEEKTEVEKRRQLYEAIVEELRTAYAQGYNDGKRGQPAWCDELVYDKRGG
jgi:hypothetical protein